MIDGLVEKVYSEDDIIMLNHSRKLLDLQSILANVHTNGAVRVSDQGWRGFKAAATYFEPEILKRIPEAELRLQYREFNRREAGGVEQDEGQQEPVKPPNPWKVFGPQGEPLQEH